MAKERKDQRQRDGSAYPITSRLWIVAFLRIPHWSPWKKGVVVVCGHREPPPRKRACAHEEKAPRLGVEIRTIGIDSGKISLQILPKTNIQLVLILPGPITRSTPQ